MVAKMVTLSRALRLAKEPVLICTVQLGNLGALDSRHCHRAKTTERSSRPGRGPGPFAGIRVRYGLRVRTVVIAMQGKKADRMVATLLVKLACFAVYGLSSTGKVTVYIPRIVILAVNANTKQKASFGCQCRLPVAILAALVYCKCIMYQSRRYVMTHAKDQVPVERHADLGSMCSPADRRRMKRAPHCPKPIDHNCN